LEYFEGTGRSREEIDTFAAYFKAQGLLGVPGTAGAPTSLADIAYSSVVRLDLGTVAPSLAGPKRPPDRIEITHLSRRFAEIFSLPVADNGFNQPADKLARSFRADNGVEVKNGDVLIAAITSCTNTSNPGVLLAAGLLAKKAVEAGLKVAPHIKTSLAPGSASSPTTCARPACCPTSSNWDSTWPPMAAPPASATPATWRRTSMRPFWRTIWSARPSSPATATSRPASTRTSRRTSS